MSPTFEVRVLATLLRVRIGTDHLNSARIRSRIVLSRRAKQTLAAPEDLRVVWIFNEHGTGTLRFLNRVDESKHEMYPTSYRRWAIVVG